MHGLIGPLLKDAGFPDGAVQVLNFAEETVGERVGAMIAHPDVRVSVKRPRYCHDLAHQQDGELYRIYQAGSNTGGAMWTASKVSL